MPSLLPCEKQLCFVASFKNSIKNKQVTTQFTRLTQTSKKQNNMARGKRKAGGRH